MTTGMLVLLFVCCLQALARAATTSNWDKIYDSGEDESSNIERIITDIEDIRNGVPIDYNYNDTSVRSRKRLPSAPGCPKNVNGRPWVHYGSIQSSGCYLVGERGPCEQGQKIFVEHGNTFGYCNCDCFEGVKSDRKNQCMFCSPRNNNLEFVFDQEVERCYGVFDQGPCNLNEWFVPIDETGEDYLAVRGSLMECELRKCPYGELGYKEDGKVKCGSMVSTTAGVFPAAPNSCGENGEYNSQMGCAETFSFER